MVALQADGITFPPRRFSRSLHFSRINYIFFASVRLAKASGFRGK